MQLYPAFEVFEDAYSAGKNQLLYARIPADLETPVSMMLKLAQARRDSFMLESVTGGDQRGRYSVIGMKPDLIWSCRGSKAQINRSARFDAHSFVDEPDDPLSALRRLIAECRIEMPAGLPPISAGIFGYLGYDMIRLVERLPHINPDPLGLPDALFLRPSVIAVLDGAKDEVTLVSPVWASDGQSARAAYAQAAERVMDALRDLDRPALAEAFGSEAERDGAAEEAFVSNTPRSRYDEIIAKAKAYICAGDIFQVVPSQRWKRRFTLPAFALYRALRRTNPSPYMFFFNFGAFQVTGASPEILVRVTGDEVTIRPIAGTRVRGATAEEDLALEADLLSDPKECAEHLMLLDLGRNDVGRVSLPGSVRPTQQFTIEHYSHVMHIVSNVVGKLKPGEDALSALLAGMPAGTVSGAPKVRAMEIIDELESEKRGVYAGGVGYFSANGDMDICIALRTAVVKDQELYIQAGGGVVYDSDAEAEYQETVNKSKALRQAASEAHLFTGSRLARQ